MGLADRHALTPFSGVFFAPQKAIRFGLCMFFKNPLVIEFSKHIVVSEVHIVAIGTGVKIICGELNLVLCDLPVLNGFDSQKNTLIEMLKLSNTSDFAGRLNSRG